MKKSLIIIIAVVAVIVIIAGVFISGYNGLVNAQTEVDGKAATIQTQLQRRADLIPNFVETVKGYAMHEQETYTAVTEARAAVQQAGTVQQQEQANSELSRAIDIWVNAVTEAYPDLKANQNFTALQDELAGTENRISTARNDYNEAAKEYNAMIRRFPKNILAGMFGFDKADYFEAAEGANDVPQVSFN